MLCSFTMLHSHHIISYQTRPGDLLLECDQTQIMVAYQCVLV